MSADLTHDNQLASRIAGGLEEDRIHAHIALQSRCLRLRRLGPAKLQPVRRHKTVQRHILALKGGNPQAVLKEDPAKRRHQQALTRTGHGSLHHDSLGHLQSTSPIV